MDRCQDLYHFKSSRLRDGKLEEFKVTQLDNLLAEKIDRAFQSNTSEICHENLENIINEYSSIELAHAAIRLPSSLRPLLFDHLLSIESKLEFMVHTNSSTRVSVFRYISDVDAKDLINKIPSHKLGDFLDDISDKKYRRLMDLFDDEKIGEIKQIKEHQRDHARQIMTKEFFAVFADMTIEDVKELVKQNPGVDYTSKFYVIDNEGRLLGFVPLRALLLNSDYTLLKDVMCPTVQKVYADTTREEVIDIVEKYKISGLPVLDRLEKIIGIITEDDVVEAVEDIADQTIACMAGTVEKFNENEPIYKKLFFRAPWLLVTLLAGLLNMSIMNLFQEYEGLFLTFVFFFVPLVTGMSGNIGLQCSTVLVRNMALGLMSKKSRKKFLTKEILLGLLTGGIFGVISGLFVYILNITGVVFMSSSALAVGLIIGVGLFGACIVGTLLGVFSPVIFSRLGIDPAVSSGPIITAFNDFLSMTIFFVIAVGLSHFLLS